ncbi:MAG TPA: 1-acyl-sn-glycerol-3-phosphate acyltransferase, partial [Ramlibacter sp.]|nr:1-acyl-sn-glycerol-3-phosphate acyltransferase [Ramlibacter sp.]
MKPGSVPPRAFESDPFDADYCRELCGRVLGPVNRHWFRPVIFGAERLPSRGPLIIASNHSGNCLPHDAIALDSFLWTRDGADPALKLRTVFEPALTYAWWLRPCGLDDFYRRGGGVDLTFDNFERLLERGDRVLYFPEGVPGIGKGFQNRYKLQPFHTSFLILAARHHVPVIPLYVINGEYTMPLHFTLKPLDRVMQRVWGVPFLPLPAGILACIIPFLWFIAFPARLTFVVGEPLDVDGAFRSEGIVDAAHAPRDRVSAVAERIRQRMQAELTQLAAIHGKRPYDVRSLVRHLRAAGRRIWSVAMTGWPVAYHRFDRDRRRAKARNRLHAIVRDWDLALFYLPLGWPMLSIA